ncbi:BrnA antitoxin family protein [Siccirubricoccus sp. KC 17139]|uniref:BrnA antitoxin family protein n=1 Tax=Siccirubricoccus soli TaxID=2899147 RepID=A0ABT1D6V6_9PROT|nr:BrnA antitoxin family protein [Siccirubricoccus soli]MCO6417656.1 BrnA antitoxin family protein [Siccirubricoccus soli]MCP2683791.1 BrnA antitoxin family protein [Siccirubricoccus soli]
MKENATRRYSADELRARAARGESRTDAARIEAMSEAELERSIAADPDWQGVPEDWYLKAEAVMPRPKVAVSLRLDADLVEEFRASGRGWQTRINAILRAYSQARKTPAAE